MKTLPLIATLALLISHALGATHDDHHFLLDQSLSKEAAQASPFVFNNVREALTAINGSNLPASDTLTLEIAPGVYWVDDPDDPAVRRGSKAGVSIPYGFKVKGPNLRLIGLCTDAQDVVLACNRGQTQGAIGNFTMLHLDCPYVEARNVTFGNYCSVELVYPRNTALNRQKRCNANVQAQLIHTTARFVDAQNCRFVSRLNLCPFSGVYRAHFKECHFECTDDALEGAAIYEKCHFDFYSNKPFWGTPECGAVFLDCNIDSHVDDVQYFIKSRGSVALLRTNIRQVNGKDIQIVPCYEGNNALSYYSELTVNGKPAELEGAKDISDMVLKSSYTVENLLHGPFPVYMRIVPIGGAVLKELEDTKSFQFLFYKWNGEQTQERISTNLLLNATLLSGLTGSTSLQMEAHLHPAPTFVRQPSIIYDKDQGRLLLDYQLSEGSDERSQICWYRYTKPDASDAVPVLLRWNPSDRTYTLSPADAGCYVMARINPKYFATVVGEAATASLPKPIAANAIGVKGEESHYETDFRNVPVGYQPTLKNGCWTFDTYKPFDTQAFFWHPINDNCWYYGVGMDGASKTMGLLQGARGARCFYQPARRKCSEMEVSLHIVPAKTAGQGFGSATGQYMDIGIMFDPVTLTGYALRIQRLPDYDHSCAFQLVLYKDGRVTTLGEQKISACYKGTCSISISFKSNVLSASATNGEHSEDVRLSVPNLHSSSKTAFYIQHTGSVGPSASLIKDVQMDWK